MYSSLRLNVYEVDLLDIRLKYFQNLLRTCKKKGELYFYLDFAKSILYCSNATCICNDFTSDCAVFYYRISSGDQKQLSITKINDGDSSTKMDRISPVFNMF